MISQPKHHVPLLPHEAAEKVFGLAILIMQAMSTEMRQTATGTLYGQMSVLLYIYHAPMTQRDLAQSLNVSGPTISGSVDALETRGWVVRERDAADRRVVWVRITPDGRATVDAMAALFESRLAAAYRTLTPDEQHALAIGLDALATLFTRLMAHAGDGVAEPKAQSPPGAP
jgi:DNA-binding MarR family transcriptional regulator